MTRKKYFRPYNRYLRLADYRPVSLWAYRDRAKNRFFTQHYFLLDRNFPVCHRINHLSKTFTRGHSYYEYIVGPLYVSYLFPCFRLIVRRHSYLNLFSRRGIHLSKCKEHCLYMYLIIFVLIRYKRHIEISVKFEI